MTTTERVCENCAAFEASAEYGDVGACRRYAPRPISMGLLPCDDELQALPHAEIALFPEVSPDDWCLEFVPKGPAA
jgi:hypothetical protein